MDSCRTQAVRLLPSQRTFLWSCHGGYKAKNIRHLSLAYNLYEPPGAEPTLKHSPIIIMHGLFGSKQNNRSISKALVRDLQRPMYAIDLRNHGDSPHDAKHDYSTMAEDIKVFIEEHGLKNPTLIGHSMGAKVAMTVALQSYRLLGALIAVDNAPVDATLKSDFAKYVQGMRKIEDARVMRQVEADGILKGYEENRSIRQFLLTNLVRRPDSSYLKFRIPIKVLAAALDHMGDFPFKDPDEAHYDGPTLFIRGTRSRYVADDVLPLIGRFFPRFELQDIESGHWVISEKPEQFRQAVVDFLQDKD